MPALLRPLPRTYLPASSPNDLKGFVRRLEASVHRSTFSTTAGTLQPFTDADAAAPAPASDGSESLAPLTADVRALGHMFGDWVSAREGKPVLATIETIRGLSKRWRVSGDRAAFEQLVSIVDAMSAKDALVMARAFSHFLALANAAEQHHRVRPCASGDDPDRVRATS